MLSQEVQVSGCMHIRSFQHLNPITVAFTKPTMLDLNDAVFWTFTFLPSVSPSKQCICQCNMLILVRSTSDLESAMFKCVHEGTRCVCYLIPTGVLALMSTIQNHKSTIFGHNLSFQKPPPPLCRYYSTMRHTGCRWRLWWKYNQGPWQHQLQAESVRTRSGLIHAEDSYGQGVHSFSAGEDAVTEGRGGLWSLCHCLCHWTLQWQQSSKLPVSFRGLLWVCEHDFGVPV